MEKYRHFKTSPNQGSSWPPNSHYRRHLKRKILSIGKEGRQSSSIKYRKKSTSVTREEERITFMRELVNKGDLRWTPPRLTQKTNSLPMLEKGK